MNALPRVVAAALTFILVIGAQPPSAGAMQPASAAPPGAAQSWPLCDKTMGERLPVFVVHGFRSNPDTWNDAVATLGAVEGTCWIPFDYTATSTKWVTDRENARRLAQLIVSFANRSQSQGGPGKVAVVAHSMGGLMARCAATKSCHGGPDDARSNIASVTTFGTPNTGSFLRAHSDNLRLASLGALDLLMNSVCIGDGGRDWCAFVTDMRDSAAARAFTPGSPELNALPPMAKNVPVHAVAGELRLRSTLFNSTVDLGSIGDTVVLDSSALDGAQEVGGLGGETTIDCGVINIVGDGGAPKSCEHTSQTRDQRFLKIAADEVRAAVAQVSRPRLGHDSLGPVTIGMSAKDMDRLAPSLGLEGYESNFSSDEYAFCNRWSNDAKGVSVTSTNGDPPDVVFDIRVYGEQDTGQPRLPNGVGIGSTRRQVTTNYPGGENYGGDAINGYKVDIAGPTGLFFVFDDADNVRILAVMADKWLDYDETCG